VRSNGVNGSPKDPSDFNDNTGKGGALCLLGPATIDQSGFYLNYGYAGGGIYTKTNGVGTVSLINSSLIANAIAGAAQPGAGIYLASGPMSVLNSTLASNQGVSEIHVDPKGVSSTGVDFQNSIVDAGTGILACSGSTAKVVSVTSLQSARALNPGSCTGGNATVADAQLTPVIAFASPFTTPSGAVELYGRMLEPASLALNAGTPSVCTKVGQRDQLGEVRAPKCDIGAIETPF
jgi:hypothetical protein